MSYAPDWSRVSNKILTRPGRVLVLGRPDTGKTSFTQFLASQGLKRRLKVGIVDLDPGQSWIGPPATIGLGIPLQARFEPDQLFPKSLYFIGATSPAHHSAQIIAGLEHLLKRTGRLDLLIFDSSGYLGSPDARRLIAQIIELIQPRHLVKLGQVEVSKTSAQLYNLEPSAAVQRRSTAQRRQIRNSSWQHYFKEAIRRRLPGVLITGALYPSQLLGLFNPAKELSGLGICVKPAPEFEILTPVRSEIAKILPGAIGLEPSSHSELSPTAFELLKIVRDQTRLHPKIGLEDLHKLLAQAVGGGAHLRCHRHILSRALRTEWNGLLPPIPDEPLIEPIDPSNRWVRINLRPYKARGGDLTALCAAVLKSSLDKGRSPSLSGLWRILERLAYSRLIPFDPEELKNFESRLSQSPVHSPKYLKKYHPAYRLIARRYLPSLLKSIRNPNES